MAALVLAGLVATPIAAVAAVAAGVAFPIAITVGTIALASEVFTMQLVTSTRLELSVSEGLLRVCTTNGQGQAPASLSVPVESLTQLFVMPSARNGDRASLWACVARGEDICLATNMKLAEATLWEATIERDLGIVHHPLPGTYCRLTERTIPLGRDLSRAKKFRMSSSGSSWNGPIIGPEVEYP